jgi:hypothetical protein
MTRTARALAVAVLGIALALGSAAAASAAPTTPDTTSDTAVSAAEIPGDSADVRRTVLGGVDLVAFCQAFGYRDVTLQEPETVWNWYCLDYYDRLVDINMFAACQWQYQEQWAKPDYYDEQNAYSWYCYLD